MQNLFYIENIFYIELILHREHTPMSNQPSAVMSSKSTSPRSHSLADWDFCNRRSTASSDT